MKRRFNTEEEAEAYARILRNWPEANETYDRLSRTHWSATELTADELRLLSDSPGRVADTSYAIDSISVCSNLMHMFSKSFTPGFVVPLKLEWSDATRRRHVSQQIAITRAITEALECSLRTSCADLAGVISDYAKASACTVIYRGGRASLYAAPVWTMPFSDFPTDPLPVDFAQFACMGVQVETEDDRDECVLWYRTIHVTSSDWRSLSPNNTVAMEFGGALCVFKYNTVGSYLSANGWKPEAPICKKCQRM